MVATKADRTWRRRGRYSIVMFPDDEFRQFGGYNRAVDTLVACT